VGQASIKKQKKRRLQAANFPPPKHLLQEQVSEICATSRISDRHTVLIKDFLDDLVDHVNGWMFQGKRQTDNAIASILKTCASRSTQLRVNLGALGSTAD